VTQTITEAWVTPTVVTSVDTVYHTTTDNMVYVQIGTRDSIVMDENMNEVIESVPIYAEYRESVPIGQIETKYYSISPTIVDNVGNNNNATNSTNNGTNDTNGTNGTNGSNETNASSGDNGSNSSGGASNSSGGASAPAGNTSLSTTPDVTIIDSGNANPPTKISNGTENNTTGPDNSTANGNATNGAENGTAPANPTENSTAATNATDNSTANTTAPADNSTSTGAAPSGFLTKNDKSGNNNLQNVIPADKIKEPKIEQNNGQNVVKEKITDNQVIKDKKKLS
jgi:hypothetical protein